MNYEEKYNEILEWARKNKARLNGVPIEEVLPELRESEDESTRKALIETVKCIYDGDTMFLSEQQRDRYLAYLEKQKEQKPIIQDVELNDAVYDYVRDHFIVGADFTPEYIKKLMENAFFAGVDYYLLKQEFESCEPDTNVEKVIEDVIRVYGKTQGEWVGGYDVDTLIVNLRRAFNKKGQKPAEWSEEDERNIRNLESVLYYDKYLSDETRTELGNFLKSLRPSWKPSEEQMKALQNAVALTACDKELARLYNQLKKLGVEEEPEYYQHFDPDC